jgi:hypothetical protein
LGEHLRKFGINIAPAAAAEAVCMNDLRDKFVISLRWVLKLIGMDSTLAVV